MICNACPRKCKIDRENARGFCQSPARFRLARAALHFWEEPCISGTNGSGAVFFSGCNLRCVFCQNGAVSRDNTGREVSDEALIGIFEKLIEQGAHNINLVTPTHYAPRLASLLRQWRCPVPVVYNTSAYESVETLRLLDGLVDIYLPDFKYTRPEKALRYSGAEDYHAVAAAALAEMRRQRPVDEYDADGIMQKGVIVRHLVLPRNTNTALEVVDMMARDYPDTALSLMAQYTPCGDLSAVPELQRKLTAREYTKVVTYADRRGLSQVFVQELTAADKKFIPAFDFTGIM